MTAESAVPSISDIRQPAYPDYGTVVNIVGCTAVGSQREAGATMQSTGASYIGVSRSTFARLGSFTVTSARCSCALA